MTCIETSNFKGDKFCLTKSSFLSRAVLHVVHRSYVSTDERFLTF